jgi:aspartokinase
MDKIRLGGIKIAEGRSHLVTANSAGKSALPDICARLAANRINLNHLTSLDAAPEGEEAVSLCVDRAEGYNTYFQIKALLGGSDRIHLQEDANILAVFPHEKKPGVAGNLLRQLASLGVPVHGLASSPAAMAFVVAAADTMRVIDALFEAFTFPAYPSPFDWYAAYQGREQVLKEIICSYEEQVIKVYNVAQEKDLDLWHLEIPGGRLGDLGMVLDDADRAGLRLPFLVAIPLAPELESLQVACCLARSAQTVIQDCLGRHLPMTRLLSHQAAALFSLVGPHFGDRHGITSVLVNAMRSAGIAPLGMSCAIHSISVVVGEDDLDRTLQVLKGPFDIPA